jgi:signal transduction histidine kinase
MDSLASRPVDAVLLDLQLPDGGQVTVRTSAEGHGYFRVEVQDTGPGIAPQDIGRLFAEFQQLESGTTRRHPGTGLGLALTKRLVQAQGAQYSTYRMVSTNTFPSTSTLGVKT